MTMTCACGNPAGTAPVVQDAEGNPLCDTCVSRAASPQFLARVDQGRAHARATVGQVPDDEAHAWMKRGMDAYFAAGHHDMLTPMTIEDRVAFLAWLQAVDPDGWALHRDVLLAEDED